MFTQLQEIKAMRKKIGITQKTLAHQSGVSQSLIAKIESGTIDPTYTKAQAILDTLHSMLEQKEQTVGKLMNSRIISVPIKATVKRVITIMKRHSFSQLPVVEKGIIRGLISESSILNAIIEGKQHMKVEDIMAEAPPVVSQSATSSMVLDLLKFYPMVIVQNKGNPVGLVTKSDIIRKLYA